LDFLLPATRAGVLIRKPGASSPDSTRPLGEERPPAFFAMRYQRLDISRAAVELTLVIQRSLHLLGHLDPRDVVGFVGLLRERLGYAHLLRDIPAGEKVWPESVLHYQVVDQFDPFQVLEHRDVAFELIAPVSDLVRLYRGTGTHGRIDLDDPELVREVGSAADDARAHQVVERRVIGEQTIPQRVAVQLHGRKQVRHRSGGQEVLDPDRLLRRIELAQPAGEHAGRR
jgi:hypothetical protein